MNDQGPLLDLISRYQDAWTSRDFNTAAGLVADDMVFRSPQQHIVGASGFFTMLRGFATRVAPRWQLVSATEADDEILVLYHLFSDEGHALACADHFRVRDGKIVSELLVFDVAAFAAAAAKRDR
jgi:ketosteroid isomerase-like protein